MQTISLAMIVRDEEANLEKCLNSVKEEVDEIIIVDTGSCDQTLKIASNFTDKIYNYEWSDDFSAARNFAISKCTGHWILSLDADEKLDSEAVSLRQLIAGSTEAEAFFLPLLFCAGGEGERFAVIRFFRNSAEYRFAGKIHEQIVIKKTDVVGMAAAPVICHKLVIGQERNKKRSRNLQMLRQAVNSEPDNYYLKYYLGVEWLGIRRFEKAAAYFQEAVANIEVSCAMFRVAAVRYLVDCLKFLGRLDDALQVCRDECDINPVYTDVFFEAGAILEEQGKFKEAIDYFLKAMQLGVPPLVFYHSQGTESFLAFYHLAFCYEKIGCQELAENYYWQALAANPNYVCPLYSLFLLKIINLKAADVFLYFKNKKSFILDQWVRTLAGLFLAAGLPQFAAACYEQSGTLCTDNSIDRIKSLLYSGRVQEALKVVSSIEETEVPVEIRIEEIVANIIKGDYSTAKQRALKLWTNSPAQRSKTWALLAIIARSSSSGGYNIPEKPREMEVNETYLSVLENCLHFNFQYPQDTCAATAFTKLKTTVVDMLAESSAQSNLCLAEFFQRKAGEVRSLLDYKHISARGLYV